VFEALFTVSSVSVVVLSIVSTNSVEVDISVMLVGSSVLVVLVIPVVAAVPAVSEVND
jgi:hypothetical protein